MDKLTGKERIVLTVAAIVLAGVVAVFAVFSVIRSVAPGGNASDDEKNSVVISDTMEIVSTPPQADVENTAEPDGEEAAEENIPEPMIVEEGGEDAAPVEEEPIPDESPVSDEAVEEGGEDAAPVEEEPIPDESPVSDEINEEPEQEPVQDPTANMTLPAVSNSRRIPSGLSL